MLKLGAAKKEAGRAWSLVDILVPETDEELAARGFSFRLRRDRLRQVRRREGRYLLRSNMTAEDPATLWRLYMQLIEIEQAFKELKHDLAIRPVFHQREDRIEAHIFVSFIAYCLLVTLKNLARPHACGLTPRAILESFATIQMVDVHLPTADGRHLILPRHTRPNKEHELLLPPARHDPADTARAAHLCLTARRAPFIRRSVVPTFERSIEENQLVSILVTPELRKSG